MKDLLWHAGFQVTLKNVHKENNLGNVEHFWLFLYIQIGNFSAQANCRSLPSTLLIMTCPELSVGATRGPLCAGFPENPNFLNMA